MGGDHENQCLSSGISKSTRNGDTTNNHEMNTETTISSLEVAKKHGVATVNALSLLLHLHKSGPLTMSDGADAVGMSNSSMTGTTDRLEALGLVIRKPSEDDRRINVVTITDAGATVAREIETKTP